MDFRQRIIDAADRWPIEDARLLRLLANPRAPQSLVQEFALGVLVGAHHFAQAVALLFCQADDPRAKHGLLENLLEETGVANTGGKMRCRPAQAHTVWARRFCHACQLDDTTLDQALASRPRWPEPAFHLLDRHDWKAALAYLIVGYERASPRYMQSAHTALLQRGFQKADLVFFHNHIEADALHSEHGVEMLAAIATTPEEQSRLLEYVRLGAGDFWSGLNRSQNRQA